MRYITVGTAGHVDHGKTSFIKFFTGTDTDRLEEEKRRGMTIELGFAFLPVSSDFTISFIDVPGHEKFLKNMLSGITGIDSVILIIAANEGVMPQTIEHIQIIKLLNISNGIVVITKKDLVEEEFFELVLEDVKEIVKDLFPIPPQIFSFSTLTGEGKDEIINHLKNLVNEIQERNSNQKTVFPVDRVFTKHGFGTIVTGTLFSGKINSGDTLQVIPSGELTKIKQIEIHGKKNNIALSGQRVALGISDINVKDINRGNILISPDSYFLTDTIDVKVKILPELSKMPKTNDRVRFYHLSSETIGRISFTGKKSSGADESSFARIKFETPVVIPFGTKFIIRNYSPMYIIGGGEVLNPYPLNFKLNTENRIKILKYYENKNFIEIIRFYLNKINRIFTIKELKLLIPVDYFDETINTIRAENSFIELGNSFYVTSDYYKSKFNELISFISNFHKNNPLKKGISKQELQKILKFDLNLLENILTKAEIGNYDNVYFIAEIKPVLSTKDESDISLIIKLLEKERFQNKKDLHESTKINNERLEDLIKILFSENKVEKISEDIIVLKEIWNNTVFQITELLKVHNRITTAQAKEHIKTSRKYIIPILETLDKRKITRRESDFRVLILDKS